MSFSKLPWTAFTAACSGSHLAEINIQSLLSQASGHWKTWRGTVRDVPPKEEAPGAGQGNITQQPGKVQ